MNASNSSIADGYDQENCPDSSDDSTDGEDQNVKTGHDEWGAGCDDEGLNWWRDLRFCGDDLGGEDPGDEGCFVGGKGCVDGLASGVDCSQGDGWDENFLESSTVKVSI